MIVDRPGTGIRNCDRGVRVIVRDGLGGKEVRITSYGYLHFPAVTKEVDDLNDAGDRRDARAVKGYDAAGDIDMEARSDHENIVRRAVSWP